MQGKTGNGQIYVFDSYPHKTFDSQTYNWTFEISLPNLKLHGLLLHGHVEAKLSKLFLSFHHWCWGVKHLERMWPHPLLDDNFFHRGNAISTSLNTAPVSATKLETSPMLEIAFCYSWERSPRCLN